MDKATVNELVKDVVESRNDEAMSILYREIYQPLVSFLGPILHSKQDIEDIIHDTFLQVMDLPKSTLWYHNCFAYIFTIAKHKSLNFLIRNKRISECALEDCDCVAQPKDKDVEIRIDLERELAKLKLNEEQIVRLHYVAGYSFVEISKILKKNVSTVKQTAYRALEKMKKNMSKT